MTLWAETRSVTNSRNMAFFGFAKLRIENRKTGPWTGSFQSFLGRRYAGDIFIIAADDVVKNKIRQLLYCIYFSVCWNLGDGIMFVTQRRKKYKVTRRGFKFLSACHWSNVTDRCMRINCANLSRSIAMRFSGQSLIRKAWWCSGKRFMVT